MKRITDPAFRYVPSAETTPEYLRAKFRKIIREQAERKSNVKQLKTKERA